jgi:hypothetical protein
VAEGRRRPGLSSFGNTARLSMPCRTFAPKVVAGPAGPVSSSSLRLVECFIGASRQAPMIGCPVGLYAVSGQDSESVGRSPQGSLAAEWQVASHRPSPAVWPNPSVKGTSRKRAAPYVER